jgi:hypothetical protein
MTEMKKGALVVGRFYAGSVASAIVAFALLGLPLATAAMGGQLTYEAEGPTPLSEHVLRPEGCSGSGVAPADCLRIIIHQTSRDQPFACEMLMFRIVQPWGAARNP